MSGSSGRSFCRGQSHGPKRRDHVPAGAHTPYHRGGIYEDRAYPLPGARYLHRHRFDGHHRREGRRCGECRAGEGRRARLCGGDQPHGDYRGRRLLHLRCPVCREPRHVDHRDCGRGESGGTARVILGAGPCGRGARAAPRGGAGTPCHGEAHVERHIPPEPRGRKGYPHPEIRRGGRGAGDLRPQRRDLPPCADRQQHEHLLRGGLSPFCHRGPQGGQTHGSTAAHHRTAAGLQRPLDRARAPAPAHRFRPPETDSRGGQDSPAGDRRERRSTTSMSRNFEQGAARSKSIINNSKHSP